MTFSWTQHRFSGGALALDVANSVILRHDKARSTDRFGLPEHLESFTTAAGKFCAERALFGSLSPVPVKNQRPFLELREAVDAYFRACVLQQQNDGLLADLLETVSTLLRRASGIQSLERATAHSAIRLLSAEAVNTMKICGHCGWLFIDRSRNRSRLWCDMAVCGNRAKAKRHYRRKKDAAE